MWLDPHASDVEFKQSSGRPIRNPSEVTAVNVLPETNHVAVGHQNGTFYLWYWSDNQTAPSLWDYKEGVCGLNGICLFLYDSMSCID